MKIVKRETLVVFFGLVIALGLFGSGCGKDAAPAASKDLFSVWTASDNSVIIDLRGMSFGAGMHMGVQANTGETCYCGLALGGTQASGTAIRSGCTYTGGGGGVDPGCASLNQTYTFTDTAAILRICDVSQNCLSYH